MNFKYNYEKNSQLLETRGIGFEEIIQAISEGNILAFIKATIDIINRGQYAKISAR